jgi:molybdopterin/thiamine biosynthesis adenylyltransferase
MSNQYIRNHREKYIQSEMFSNNANASASNNTSVYQRQEELQGWDQNLVASLTCLVLGVGGLGSHISSGLCRLGVKKIILVDMDVVDVHNLNRQILYRAEHVGRPKVECAVEELTRHHINGEVKTELEYHHTDCLKGWQVTMTLILQSDVIFNTVDHGDYFDYVLSMVAQKYKKPMVLGGTEPRYGHTVSYFLQGIREGKIDPTYWDCHDLTDPTTVINSVLGENSLELIDDISALPKDVHPVAGGSTVYSAGICSHLMTCSMINYLMHLKNPHRTDPPKQMIFNLLSMESFSWFSSSD